MGRGLAGRPVACDVHPHHPAIDRCDECLRHYCAACFVRNRERLLRRTCHEAVPLRAAEAARRARWSYRLAAAFRERRSSLVAGAIIVGFLGGGAALAVFGAWTGTGSGRGLTRALADEPAVLQRAAAARYCAVGQGTSGNPAPAAQGGPPPTAGSPVLTAPTGALVAAVAGVLPDTLLHDDRLAGTPLARSPLNPMNLVLYRDGFVVPLSGWRSQTGLLPQQVGYELRAAVTVDRVAFQQAPAMSRESWARDVGLLLSATAPDAGFYQVGRWTLAQTTAPQEFTFVETQARYARMCLYANDGGQDYISLGAIVLGVMLPPHLLDTQSKPLLQSGR